MALDTAVIPCGGLGRRLRPITNWVPKEMLPVGLKPALYWALDEAASAGLLRVILIVTPHKPVIEAAARQYQGPLELEFVPQAAFRGLGDAILSARDALAGSPFLLLQPDQLFDGPNPTSAVLAAYRASRRTTVALVEIGKPEATRTGALGRAVVRPRDGNRLLIESLDARGASLGRFDVEGEAVLAPTGRVAYTSEVFSDFDAVAGTVPPGAEIDDRPVLQRIASRGALEGVTVPARLFDLGVPEGYRDAVSRWPARVT
jgi:UTP-glucose-1-phosphate uridylyltransferase